MAEEHLKAFNSISKVKTVGIYSRNLLTATKLAQKYNIFYVASSIEDLFLKSKADALIVTVPELELLNILSKSCRFPWVHLVEKPPGYNLREAKRILSLADKYQSKIFVALNRRSQSGTKELLKNLDNMSTTRFVSVVDQENTLSAIRSGQPEKVVKNWMFANSIHLIDFFTLICQGEVSSVKSKRFNISEYQYILKSELIYSSGDFGFYLAYWNMPGPWSVSCNSGDFHWELKPLEKLSYRTLNSHEIYEHKNDISDIEFKPGLMSQGLELLKYLETGQCVLPNLKESFKTMNLIQLIYKDIIDEN